MGFPDTCVLYAWYIGGVVLSDYSNASLATGPSDWRRVGTNDLFVNDTFHWWTSPSTLPPYNRPMINNAVDSSGRDMAGSYKVYYIDDLALWAQIYTRYYGSNMLDDYPIVKIYSPQEVWTSLPNKYSSDYVTDGNIIMGVYGMGIANLLDSANRSYVLNNAALMQYNFNSGLLPYYFKNANGYYYYSNSIGRNSRLSCTC